MVEKLEEADRQAEIQHQKWLAEQELRRREEDRRAIEKSVTDSKAELRQVIERWSNIMGIECFLAGVEQRADELPESEKQQVCERLALARAFLGSQDPLDFFRDWKTPNELYAPRYFEEEQISPV